MSQLFQRMRWLYFVVGLLLIGVLLALVLEAVLNNGLQFAGAPLALRNLVIGVVVIISVLIDRIARGGKFNFLKKR